jgi:hypothetical protein
MLLGSFKTDKYKIDVLYNMGPKERAARKEGIVRPSSFRVWTTGASPSLVRVVDFELAYFNGKIVSAAVGETSRQGRANFGILEPKSDFAAVKKKILEVISK